MRAKIQIAKVYSELLEETETDIIIEANNKTFKGALFFEIDPWERVTEVLEEVVLDTDVLTIILKAYDLMKKHGRIAKDDKTLLTMIHWQYMNHFSNDMLDEIKPYSYKTDAELLKTIRR